MSKPKVKVYSQANPPPRVVKEFTKPSRTEQFHKDECDVNRIVARAMKHGQWGPEVRPPGLYGDYSDVRDFQESMNIVIRAQEQFDNLSAAVRDRFANDPARFLAFMGDPANGAEIVKLGLGKARPVPDPTPAAPPAKAVPGAVQAPQSAPAGGSRPGGPQGGDA